MHSRPCSLLLASNVPCARNPHHPEAPRREFGLENKCHTKSTGSGLNNPGVEDLEDQTPTNTSPTSPVNARLIDHHVARQAHRPRSRLRLRLPIQNIPRLTSTQHCKPFGMPAHVRLLIPSTCWWSSKDFPLPARRAGGNSRFVPPVTLYRQGMNVTNGYSGVVTPAFRNNHGMGYFRRVSIQRGCVPSLQRKTTRAQDVEVM
jgi:hypothetical protein